MKTYGHLLPFPAEFLLELEMFQTRFVENKNTHFLFNDFSPRKSRRS